MSYINKVSPGSTDESADLKAAYEQIGPAKGANILQVQSLHPTAMLKHYEFYRTLMFSKSPLSRSFRELIAFAVSKWNHCHY